jgi:hypothetical protein
MDLAILYTIKSHKHPEGEQGHLWKNKERLLIG